jgi:RNA polymerase sigma-70 factor (ECF subfamily)
MEPMPPLVSPVLAQCAEGDRSAWRELHRAYFPVVHGFLRAMGVPPADLDDVSQEVFVVLFRSIRQFEGRSAFRTWLYRLCVTQATRARRRAKVRAKLGWLLGDADRAVAAAAAMEWDEGTKAARMQKALDALSEKHRLVLVLRELEGLEVEAIAEIAGCPPATVWTRLHYARKEIEASLGGRE